MSASEFVEHLTQACFIAIALVVARTAIREPTRARTDIALFFAVTAELCPSQIGRSATLWHVDADDKLSRCFSIEKDWLHRVVFMVGTLHLPCGPGSTDRLHLHGVALKGADQRTFVLRRK